MSFSDLLQNKLGNFEEELSELRPFPAGSLEKFVQKFSHSSEEFNFYQSTITLRFDKDKHVYYRLGALGELLVVDGVTNTTHIINASERLVPWAAKKTVEKMLRIIPTAAREDGTIVLKPLTLAEFTTIALEAKNAHREHLEDAGDVGHMAHRCLEDSIRRAIQSDPEKIVRQLINLPSDERAINAANGGKAWMDAHHVRWIETEGKIYSRLHNFAGTADGLAICNSCEDKACCSAPFKDHLSLIDWKSSNYLNVSFLFQTAAYQHAKQEESGLDIKDRWVIRLGKSEDEAGKVEPWFMSGNDFVDDFAGFISCLNLTRLVRSADERMKAQKGNIRAIRKEQRETSKAIEKEQSKLAKALEKAEAKRLREEDKARIKAEAKETREQAKQSKIKLPMETNNE